MGVRVRGLLRGRLDNDSYGNKIADDSCELGFLVNRAVGLIKGDARRLTGVSPLLPRGAAIATSNPSSSSIKRCWLLSLRPSF